MSLDSLPGERILGELLGGDRLLSIAIPRPIHRLFTYRVPKELLSQIEVGKWLRVPFGKSSTHGFIVEPPKGLEELPEGLTLDSVKNILSVGGSIPADVWALCKWTHEYYGAPLGETLNCAAGLLDIGIQKQAVGAKPRARKHAPLPEIHAPELTPDQAGVLENLWKRQLSGTGLVTLLKGVTGSGKTEIYIEMARRVLAQGKSVLILVPEIALTPQLHHRFESRLGERVGLWHSALAQGSRTAYSKAMLDGKLRVVVGARSAIFAPLKNLSLIIVDEEHDPTYKQEDRVKYNARDLSVVRAKFSGANVILGSATPSLETLERVRGGRYAIERLTRRVSKGGFPTVTFVDLANEELMQDTQALFARTTVEAIQKTIDSGEQVLIFLNRRGFAAFLICSDCKSVSECPQCSISLTVHKRASQLRCHVCGHEESIPNLCQKCQGYELRAVGAGTESLEEDIPKLILNARVQRLDRDRITSTSRLNQVLDDFRAKKTNILLGTQMLVKGHDFPGVTLVVVVLADALFRWPDFRASERAYQILKQVAGRSGRGDQAGQVLIQTYDPEHSVLLAVRGDLSEESFLESERDLREGLNYPPFCRIARLRFESKERAQSREQATQVLNLLTMSDDSIKGVEILGPSEAFLERARGIYRWDLLFKSKDIRQMHEAIKRARVFCASRQYTMTLDVDPLGA